MSGFQGPDDGVGNADIRNLLHANPKSTASQWSSEGHLTSSRYPAHGAEVASNLCILLLLASDLSDREIGL
ncbi:hypothetical protein EVAR_102887_1 [Eumeta japonica]|uniref:Uncharacterized protein n=1 Tax=Eumeta variegata TaxID=151549 RepID=A0A4C1UNU1_EUMVA|nr:hypothetical protein EVAR_102887_1 [Eumeta japonica]